MNILDTAIAQVRTNARLLMAAGLDAEETVAKMQETASLYSEALACGEVGRRIRAEAHVIAENADVDLGDSDREIARMLCIVAYNLHMIRVEGETEPVR